MTDRELLKLAAKAAGVQVPKESPWGGVNATDGVWRDISSGGDGTRHWRWNPLKDDGDALRLAVKLRFDVCIGDSLISVVEGVTDETAHMEIADGDAFAATRRAIVRAAAEIAKAGEPKCVVEKV